VASVTKAAAVSLTAAGQVELIEREVLELLPDEVRVTVQAVGICTLEKRLFLGKLKLGYPLVPGHEVAGVIAEVGPQVLGGFKPGQRVALDLLTRCGQCHWCRRGASNRCENRFRSRRGALGGMSAQVVVPGREVFVLPDTLPPQVATLAEPLADCLHSLGRAGLTHQGPVAVVGLGVMGLLHTALLHHLGHTVLGVDMAPLKREMASDFGATVTAPPAEASAAMQTLNGGYGATSVIVTAPGVEALETGLGLLAKGGTMVVYSSYDNDEHLPLAVNRLHYDEITITGSEGRTEVDFQRAVDLLASAALDLSPLISRTFPAAQAQEAFQTSLSPDLFRVVLNF
jgi:L-iditol 2-dehydrogenase